MNFSVALYSIFHFLFVHVHRLAVVAYDLHEFASRFLCHSRVFSCLSCPISSEFLVELAIPETKAINSYLLLTCFQRLLTCFSPSYHLKLFSPSDFFFQSNHHHICMRHGRATREIVLNSSLLSTIFHFFSAYFSAFKNSMNCIR